MNEYYSIQSSKDVIKHFGIKGMRWGIRSRHSGLKQLHNKMKDSSGPVFKENAKIANMYK